jgi:hypothetical protein
MNVSRFIGASSAILLAWLGVTFFHQVPFERYPNQNRPSTESASLQSNPDSELIAKNAAAASTNH